MQSDSGRFSSKAQLSQARGTWPTTPSDNCDGAGAKPHDRKRDDRLVGPRDALDGRNDPARVEALLRRRPWRGAIRAEPDVGTRWTLSRVSSDGSGEPEHDGQDRRCRTDELRGGEIPAHARKGRRAIPFVQSVSSGGG